MKRISLFLFATLLASLMACSNTNNNQPQTPATMTNENTPNTAATADASAKTVFDFKVKDIDGNDVDLSVYKGKVLVFVNVASQCGYTPQYSNLQEFYAKYKDKGVVVLGFPANNFGGQEPGTNAEIKQFCTSKYAVTFPMFSKISVEGDDIHPLYKYFADATGEKVRWNFNKYLVDKSGKVVAHFGSGTKVTEEKCLKEIDKLLSAN
jgi:glutathione peroxidase